MKRMKKLLAFLLATMLLLTMIPISASAVDDVYTGYGTFYYHVSDVALEKILVANGYAAGDLDDIKEVSISFKDNYAAGGMKTFVFRNGYTIALSNVSDSVQPDDVDHITIEFDSKSTLDVNADRLDFDLVDTPRRYEVRLAGASDTYTVTFLYQRDGNIGEFDGTWRSIEVPAGKSFKDAGIKVPEAPADLGSYQFVCWETEKHDGSGIEFSADTIVDQNLQVYARVVTGGVSGATGGLEQVRVYNPEKSVFQKALELYNETASSPVEIGKISIEGIALNGSDGARGNPYYDTVAGIGEGYDNRWMGDGGDEYFRIINTEGGGLPETSNTRIEPSDIQGITLFVKVDGDEETHEYLIPRSELDVRVHQTRADIYLRSYTDPQPEEPTVPKEPDEGDIVGWAGDDAVSLVCDTNEDHVAKTTKLDANSLTIGNPTLVAGQYICNVTVSKDSYSYDDKHTLVENQGDGSLLLIYTEEGWVINGSGEEAYVTFHYECKVEEPGTDPEKPDAPTEEEIATYYGANVVGVVCSTKPEDHEPATYNLTAGAIDVGEPYLVKDTYYCEVTISADSYVDQYKPGGVQHELADGAPDTGSFRLYYDSIKWRLPEGQDTPYVTFNVTCDDSGEQPEEPDEPREEDIATNYGEKAVEVVCSTKPEDHEPATYNLTAGAIDVGEPYLVKDTYYCEVTISADSYVDQYKPGGVQHELADGAPDTGSFRLYYDSIKWRLAEGQNTPYVTFEVTCKDDGGQPEEPGEPTPPTEEELEDDPEDPYDPAIFAGTPIVVDCITADVNHPNENYRLFRDTYEIGDVEGNVDDGYTCDITIKAADYIYLYEVTYKAHMLKSAADKEIVVTLTYNQGEEAWELLPDFTNVTFRVTCNTTQLPGEDHYYPYPYEPEDPTDPDQTGVSDLLETDDHIQYLFGYPDDSFGPDRNMTRAEAAQMFYNLLKNKNVDAEPAFDDVPEGAWYATPVNVMAELGIVDGVGDDKFEPNREITRAEFTTMAMRFADVPSGGVNIFTDVAPSDWFYSYVVNSIQYGWIEGYGDGTFRPDRLITRAEVTTIVNRMLDRQADMAFVIQNRDKLTKFTDLTTEHWAYYTIVEATNEHNYKKPAIGEDWTSLK